VLRGLTRAPAAGDELLRDLGYELDADAAPTSVTGRHLAMRMTAGATASRGAGN